MNLLDGALSLLDAALSLAESAEMSRRSIIYVRHDGDEFDELTNRSKALTTNFTIICSRFALSVNSARAAGLQFEQADYVYLISADSMPAGWSTKDMITDSSEKMDIQRIQPLSGRAFAVYVAGP